MNISSFFNKPSLNVNNKSGPSSSSSQTLPKPQNLSHTSNNRFKNKLKPSISSQNLKTLDYNNDNTNINGDYSGDDEYDSEDFDVKDNSTDHDQDVKTNDSRRNPIQNKSKFSKKRTYDEYKKSHPKHNHNSLENDSLDNDPTVIKPKDLIYKNEIQCQPSELKLSDHQQYALECILEGESLFLTGESGTGKTTFLKYIRKIIESTGDVVAITSTTGIASISIGGKTIQSFSGLKTNNINGKILQSLCNQKNIKNRWSSIDVLIIDDISIMDPKYFSNLVYLSRNARGKKYKGKKKQDIQWIVAGDFLQITPPTTRNFNSINNVEDLELKFCFETPEWNKIFHRTINFDHNFRHEDDKVFSDLLKDIRKGFQGRINFHSTTQSRVDGNLVSDGILPTRLDFKNEIVESENDMGFKSIDETCYKFECQQGYIVGDTILPYNVPTNDIILQSKYEEEFRKHSISEKQKYETMMQLKKYCLGPPVLQLKVGAQVMLLVDLDIEKGLLNGSRGVVIGFRRENPNYPIVKFEKYTCLIRSHMWKINVTDETKAWYAQIPLRLGWACTIHKIHNQVIDKASVLINHIYEFGRVYKIISCFKSLDKFKFSKFEASCIRAHPVALDFQDRMEKKSKESYEIWKKKKS